MTGQTLNRSSTTSARSTDKEREGKKIKKKGETDASTIPATKWREKRDIGRGERNKGCHSISLSTSQVRERKIKKKKKKKWRPHSSTILIFSL